MSNSIRVKAGVLMHPQHLSALRHDQDVHKRHGHEQQSRRSQIITKHRGDFSLAMTVCHALSAMCLALSLSATAAGGAASGDNADVVYTVHPKATFIQAASEITADSWPYTPSQCISLFGLPCFTPSLIRAAYNVPPSTDGAGQSIVIIDAYGSPTLRQDLEIFSQTFGLPPVDLEVVYPLGLPPPPGPGRVGLDESTWAGETSLDVQWAHAIAPMAKIVLVVTPTANGNDLNLAQRYAIDHQLGQVMSMSFGLPEAALAGRNTAGQLQWFHSNYFTHVIQAHANYQAAEAAGITVFAASGDHGANWQVDPTHGFSEATAAFPASDPLVTAVGGTRLSMTDAGDYLGEVVWNDLDDCVWLCAFGPFYAATGGAMSTLFTAPAYQSSLSGLPGRTTSDVSYHAGTGFLVYFGFLGAVNSGFYVVDGTSAGTPQWAAITVLANQTLGSPLGFLNPKLYAIAADPGKYAQAFHDATVGDNALGGPGYSATAGYDLPTGLGSPNVAGLINLLNAP